MKVPQKFITRMLTISRTSTDLVAMIYERRYGQRDSSPESAMEHVTRRFLSRLLTIVAATIRYNPALSPRFSVPVATSLTKIAADLAFE